MNKKLMTGKSKVIVKAPEMIREVARMKIRKRNRLMRKNVKHQKSLKNLRFLIQKLEFFTQEKSK